MATNVKCPSCAHTFPLEDGLNDELKANIEREKDILRKQMIDYKKSKEDELQKKEAEWQEKVNQEKKLIQAQLEEQLRKSISADFENQVKLLQQNNLESQEKLKQAREKELEFLKKEQELKNKEAEIEINVQKKLQEERERLSLELRKIEEEKNAAKEQEHLLRRKELEKQLEDQKKLVEEMRRKAEQGSMQTQGEVQELLLEEILRNSFPFDEVKEVGKGVRGADSILSVRNSFGQVAGTIIFESKRTKDFSADWIEKLKADMRSLGADVAVLVTQALPKDMERFGEKDGIWICGFHEVKPVVHMLREGVLKVFAAVQSQENKGDKMTMLYNYLTSNEFAEQWKAIREGFMNMKLSIQKERDAMERLWKAREKQLEKVLLNAAHIHGSVEGIAGIQNVDFNLLDESIDNE